MVGKTQRIEAKFHLTMKHFLRRHFGVAICQSYDFSNHTTLGLQFLCDQIFKDIQSGNF